MDTIVGYLLDTNAINRATEQGAPPNQFGCDLLVTHIQYDEIKQTTDAVRREALLSTLAAMGAREIVTESGAWNVSTWDKFKWPTDTKANELLARITQLDKETGKKNSATNRWRDALVADTAIKRGLILVTDDVNLAKASYEFGASEVIKFNEFSRRARTRATRAL